MHPEMWEKARLHFRRQLLADRTAGMGWGTMAKKYKMNRSNLRRFVLKLVEQEVRDGTFLNVGDDNV